MNKHATENYVNQNTITHLGEIESIQTVFNEDKFRYSGIYSYTLTSGNGTKNTQLAIINGTYEEPVQYFINLDNGLIAKRGWIGEYWFDEDVGCDIWDLPMYDKGYMLGGRPFTYETEEQILNNTQNITDLYVEVEYIASYLVGHRISTYTYTGTQTKNNILYFNDPPRFVIVTCSDDESCLPLILHYGTNYAYMYEISSSGAIIPHRLSLFWGPGEVYIYSEDETGYACMNANYTYNAIADCMCEC